jgi:hypothetical protein
MQMGCPPSTIQMNILAQFTPEPEAQQSASLPILSVLTSLVLLVLLTAIWQYFRKRRRGGPDQPGREPQ